MTPVDEIDYLEESGPGIPELGAGENGATSTIRVDDDEQLALVPGWEQETIEIFLKGTGVGIHQLVGQSEKDWMMTEKDLERIAPPLTRICNRWEPALRLSPLADPLLVAHGFALYGWRSALEAKRAARDAEDELLRGPGYESGPAADVDDQAPDLGDDPDLDQPRYFAEGDSRQ